MALASASSVSSRLSAALSDAAYFESAMVSSDAIRNQLERGSPRDKLDALKRILALVSLGRDVSSFFPAVVKNVGAPQLEIKRLVYIYLQHYAEAQPDVALLSVNTFQKDLSHQNQFLRAQALRVLSSIRVPLIHQVVQMGVTKCARDTSAYVRKTAALAIPKVYALERSSRDALAEPLALLLGDSSVAVVGAALVAFAEVCPERTDMLHPHFVRICRALVDMDGYSQAIALQVLLRYARRYFNEPGAAASVHPSLTTLVQSTLPLLRSQNAAVVVSAAALLFHLSPEHFQSHAVKALVRYVHLDRALEVVALKMLCAAAAAGFATTLSRYYRELFVVTAYDGAPVRMLKLALLVELAARDASITVAVTDEIAYYLHDADSEFAAAAVRALALIAEQQSASVLTRVVRVLARTLDVSFGGGARVVAEAMTVFLSLLQRGDDTLDDVERSKLVRRIAKRLDTVESAEARASVLWLLGEYRVLAKSYAVDALRVHARAMVDERDPRVKQSTLTLAAKLALDGTDERCRRLFEYVVKVARLDPNYDVRDYACMLQRLDGDVVRGALLAKKPVVALRASSDLRASTHLRGHVLGSMAHILGAAHGEYEFDALNEWRAEAQDPLLHDAFEGGTPAATEAEAGADVVARRHGSPGGGGDARGAHMSLDEFYGHIEDDDDDDEMEGEESSEDDADESESESEEDSDGDSEHGGRKAAEDINLLSYDDGDAASTPVPSATLQQPAPKSQTAADWFSALLGVGDGGDDGGSLVQPSVEQQQQQQPPSSPGTPTLSPADVSWRILLDSHQGGGLEISYALPRDARPSEHDDDAMLPVRLRFSNGAPPGGATLSHVTVSVAPGASRIAAPSSSASTAASGGERGAVAPPEPVDRLPPGTSTERAMSVRVRDGRPPNVKLRVASRTVNFAPVDAALALTVLNAVYVAAAEDGPEQMSADEFVEKEQLLGGALAHESRVTLARTADWRAELCSRALAEADMAVVSPSSASAAGDAVRLAGRLRGSSALVLVAVKAEESGGSGVDGVDDGAAAMEAVLRVTSDDAMVCAPFAQQFRRRVLS